MESKSTSVSYSHFSSLPIELLHDVGLLLDTVSILRCSMTCKRLFQIFHFNSFWYRFCLKRGLNVDTIDEPTWLQHFQRLPYSPLVTDLSFLSSMTKNEKNSLYQDLERIEKTKVKCSSLSMVPLFKYFYMYKTRTTYYGAMDLLDTIGSPHRFQVFQCFESEVGHILLLHMDRLQIKLPAYIEEGSWSIVLRHDMNPLPNFFHFKILIEPHHRELIFPISPHDVMTSSSSLPMNPSTTPYLTHITPLVEQNAFNNTVLLDSNSNTTSECKNENEPCHLHTKVSLFKELELGWIHLTQLTLLQLELLFPPMMYASNHVMESTFVSTPTPTSTSTSTPFFSSSSSLPSSSSSSSLSMSNSNFNFKLDCIQFRKMSLE